MKETKGLLCRSRFRCAVFGNIVSSRSSDAVRSIQKELAIAERGLRLLIDPRRADSASLLARPNAEPPRAP